MKEIQRRCDSAAKSSGSLIHIKSIAIDLGSAVEEIESPGHEHFSIRGFVAGMRKKDQKVCSVFAPECNGNDLEANMPQLHAPKSRWWHCSKCIPEISTETAAIQETMLTHRSDAEDWKDKTDNRINGGNSCSNTEQVDRLLVKERDSNSAAERVEDSSLGCDGTSFSLPQKRKKKLRSLADIMKEDGNSIDHHFKVKSSSCCGMQSTSTQVEASLAPKPLLDSPVDFVKGARNLQEKRKFSLVDKEPLKMAYAACKRLKGGLKVDAERTCRKVQGTSDSESDLDASKGLESGIGANTRLNKPKKGKTLAIMNKRIRPTNLGNATVNIREMPKENSLSIQAVSDDARVSKRGSFPSTSRELRLSTRSTLPLGKLVEKNSDQSMRNQLEVRDDHSPFKCPEKNIFVECHANDKDGSGTSHCRSMDAERNSKNQPCFRPDIPDLNETFSQKTSTERGKPSPTASERSNFPTHKSLDITASCIDGRFSDANRQSQLPAVQSKGKNIEFGEASDDIPMEIVELLVRTKREKEVENLKKPFPSKGFDGAIRGYAQACPGADDFPLPYAKAGVTVANGNNTCFSSQTIPMNFPRLDGCQLGTRSHEEGHFPLFDRFSPTHQWKPHYPALSSLRSIPRHGDGTELFWPPRRENVPSFHFSSTSNYPTDPNAIGVSSFHGLCHKGKTISDIKGGERKKGALQEAKIGCSSNDAIPAMQLLSLMDRGIESSSLFNKVGSKRSHLDKPFSPCNHHPRVNEEANRSFFRTSGFPVSNHSNGFPLFSHGVYCPGESSKKASSFLQGQEKAASINAVTQQSRSKSAAVLCVVNKNPADFSIPEARNEFTLSAKDLKPRKSNALRERARSELVGGMKRGRAKRNSQGKECSKKLLE